MHVLSEMVSGKQEQKQDLWKTKGLRRFLLLGGSVSCFFIPTYHFVSTTCIFKSFPELSSCEAVTSILLRNNLLPKQDTLGITNFPCKAIQPAQQWKQVVLCTTEIMKPSQKATAGTAVCFQYIPPSSAFLASNLWESQSISSAGVVCCREGWCTQRWFLFCIYFYQGAIKWCRCNIMLQRWHWARLRTSISRI